MGVSKAVGEYNMRTDIHEMTDPFVAAASRRERKAPQRLAATSGAVDLAPCAVDAVFADESMPMFKERSSRRDRSHSEGESGAIAVAAPVMNSDDALLRSLSAQLDLLNEQQREIRILLDQAGRRRVDRMTS